MFAEAAGWDRPIRFANGAAGYGLRPPFGVWGADGRTYVPVSGRVTCLPGGRSGYHDGMKLNSPSFSKGAAIPPRFSCDGQNVSPELQWADLPDDTVSLALICEDPDAPGGVFIHWSIWGLPATKGGLGTGELPSGAHLGRNGFGDVGYGGPCPPTGHGIHHYYFRLYALDREISVPDGAEIGDVRMAIAEATLGMAELMGTYRR